MILPAVDWLKLWQESRPEIIGGLVVAILLALAAVFRKTLFGAGKNPETGPPPVVQPPPQELLIKLEPVQATPPSAPVPPPVARTVFKGHIPRPPIAGFVARRDESGRDIVERLKEELAPEKEQLIVLWGAGGVGKTTLAAETARTIRHVFEGGIIWTSAEGKPDYALSTLLDEIATHLERADLRQLAPGPKDEEVHQALSRVSNTLIVLDNFETISPEEQEKCARWLTSRASCPALITSRDQVSHAKPIRILAMSLPEAREFLKQLISNTQNPRVFAELDHDQIIQAADRIPLVLQWVVQQIDSALQPQRVLSELSHGGGDAAKRVFNRSFDLPQLGDDGRSTLLALSLFVPSASRDALREVAGLGLEHERFERAVQQLVELWLIQTSDGNARLRVEGLTRELAQARLSKDKHAQDYHRRLVSYFRNYVKAHEKALPENHAALESEKDNLLNVIEIAFNLKDWQSVYWLGYTIAFPIDGMLTVRGYWAEALKANEQALEAARRSNSQSEIADFAHNLAVMYYRRGELNEAQQLVNESLKIQRKLGQQGTVAKSLHQLGQIAYQRQELEKARRLYDESLEIKRQLNDEPGIASTLHQLAMLAHHQREVATARRLYNESLEISSKLGDRYGIASTLHNLAWIAHDEGELEEARRLYNESLSIEEELGNQDGIAQTLNMLGLLAEKEGDRKEASRLFGEALKIFKRLKSPHVETALSNFERVKGEISGDSV